MSGSSQATDDDDEEYDKVEKAESRNWKKRIDKRQSFPSAYSVDTNAKDTYHCVVRTYEDEEDCFLIEGRVRMNTPNPLRTRLGHAWKITFGVNSEKNDAEGTVWSGTVEYRFVMDGDSVACHAKPAHSAEFDDIQSYVRYLANYFTLVLMLYNDTASSEQTQKQRLKRVDLLTTLTNIDGVVV